MSQLRNRLRMLTAMVLALALVACAAPLFGLADTDPNTTEELEVVSSYPYTTMTKVKVNLRAGRSTRSNLVKKIPAGEEIEVKAVKDSWAEVTYGKYSGYVKTEFIVLKEVKKVKVTQTPTPIPTLSPEEDAGGYKILQKGSSGDAVRALQEALIELGFLTGTADGQFGSGTEKAVISFQNRNNYPATGIMDANIQAFLYTGTVKNAAGEKTTVKTLSPVEGVSMKKGNKGFAVKALQERLIELGYLKGTASGTYDTDTIGAVRSFQKKNGLTSNGTADAATRQAIHSANALPANATPTPKVTATPTPTPTTTPLVTPGKTLKKGDSGEDVKILQRRLKALKYYKSNIDGKMDDVTVKALKEFQKAHGLDADGVAGKATYAILFSNNALVKGTTPTPEVTATPTPTLTPAANVTPTPTPTATTALWPTMRRNDSGEGVAQLQAMLIALGYLSGEADGNYGAMTMAAVKAFQKANGLDDDGVAGEATQKVLFGGKAKAKPTPTPTPKSKATPTPEPSNNGVLKVGSTGSEVKSLQQKLIELGYLKDKADGVYGNKTAAAVKAYQKAKKLDADGVAGPKTLSSLNSASATKADSSNNNNASAEATAAVAQTITSKPTASQVQYANWYDKIKAVARSYPYVTIYDFATGISWQAHIFSIGAHADYEPVTANDTAKMLKAFGGVNTWNPKAVWVVFSNGSVYLGSTHSMAHDVQHTKDNNFNGHSCLHFPRTQEQVTKIGPYATKHQETIDAAWITTQKMK